MKKVSLPLAVIAMLACAIADGDIIVEYTSVNATSIAANGNSSADVTADALTSGSGLTLQAASTFNFIGWDTASTSFAAAVAANDFWSWGFDVATAGTSIALTDMNIRLDRSGTGPDDFEIQASVNGGTAISLLTFDFMDTSVGVNFTNVDLSGLGTVSTGDSVVFTLAAYNSESAAGSFDLETIIFPDGTDSIQINGDISVVIPEPSVMVIGIMATIGLIGRRRR